VGLHPPHEKMLWGDLLLQGMATSINFKNGGKLISLNLASTLIKIN